MKIGDLVAKIKGYGAELDSPLMGIIIGFVRHEDPNKDKAIVCTQETCPEQWIAKFCKVINESE